MELATATPFEIDTALADLYGRELAAKIQRATAIAEIHRALGEKAQYVTRARKAWPTTDQAAIDKAIELAPGAPEKKPWDFYYLPDALAAYEAAEAKVQEIAAAMEPLEAEFRRRPWSRFFHVQASGGHVHSSMRCKTCNRQGQPTEFGWRPELSGHTEAEAVGAEGPILCTVCFPSAPLAWTQGVQKPSCPGSGKAPQGQAWRVGMNHYGTCTGCQETEIVNQSGVIRKHKPKKEA